VRHRCGAVCCELPLPITVQRCLAIVQLGAYRTQRGAQPPLTTVDPEGDTYAARGVAAPPQLSWLVDGCRRFIAGGRRSTQLAVYPVKLSCTASAIARPAASDGLRERSRNQTPSAKRVDWREAASIARRVSPTLAGPASVSGRTSSESSARSNAASAARPSNEVGRAGRSWRDTDRTNREASAFVHRG